MAIIEQIRKCYENDKLLFTKHALEEMKAEEFGRIFEYEISESINNGKIIAEYPNDTPYPSVLIYGKTSRKRPIHTVCAYNPEEEIIIIVTVYQPDPKLWYNYERKIK